MQEKISIFTGYRGTRSKSMDKMVHGEVGVIADTRAGYQNEAYILCIKSKASDLRLILSSANSNTFSGVCKFNVRELYTDESITVKFS